jgi:hypothetical protein
MRRHAIRAAVIAGIAGLLLVVPAHAGDLRPSKPDDRATHGVGAVALEQSTAVVRPDDRAGLRGPGLAATIVVSSGLSHPDNRANHGVGAIAAGPVTVAVRPDDGAAPRGPGAIGLPVVAVTGADGGFDWGDAGIGAFGGAGIVLLLVGAAALLAARRPDTDVALR